jgi:flagellar biosynthesis chaperone FliJ
LAERLYDIYEAGGQADWKIVPTPPEPLIRKYPAKKIETPTSKRERKKKKCLAKATSRPSVVTQDEIQYIKSVIHTTGISSSNHVPSNLEEVEDIERQLQLNTRSRNEQTTRKASESSNKSHDATLGFSAELKRILNELRVAELIKRNDRNRGLRGKELRIFNTFVEAFQSRIMDDLVLVEKDRLEIEMRRAGYMRYTTKTSHSILEDRYKERDWKTGRKIVILSDSSDGTVSPLDSQSADLR